jgi:hypothetical protein
MAVTNFAAAVKYTRNQLLKHGYDREWVHDFWVRYTETGKDIRTTGAWGAEPEHTGDDDWFINGVVCDVQRFAFGDEVDLATGAKIIQPATEDEVDGKCGPMTIRRMLTWSKLAEEKVREEVLIDRVPEMTSSEHLVWAGKPVPIEGVQIVSLEEENGLDLAREAERKYGKRKGYSIWKKEAQVEDILSIAGKHKKCARNLGFVHWDAGWSAPGAFRALIRRGLGSTMGIDRPRKADGQVIVYQWLDPGLHYGWHGGSANKKSLVSFDMSCAVYAKYEDKYMELCGIPRPLLLIDKRERVGKGKYFLGMYRDQIVALMRILKALSKHTGLPYHWPLKADGSFQGRNYKRLWKDEFHGVAEHRHLPTTTKWDCRGLFAQICALLLSVPALMAEFPEFVTAHRLHDPGWAAWLDSVKKHWQWKELWGAKAA